MASSGDDKNPCTCATGLCERHDPMTGPVGTENPPGRDTLRYRPGVHGTYKEAMIRAASRTPALAKHANRDDGSAATAFIDLAAVILDNLSFYQERWMNENFLGTAKERRSLLEMANGIGYRTSPGVAAATHLAFDVEIAPGMPDTVEVPEGVQVQNIPLPGELPQFFETVQAIEALPDWNQFTAKQTRPQEWIDGKTDLTVVGTGLNLPLGSRLLILFAPRAEEDWTSVEIAKVSEDYDRKVTVFEFSHPMTGPSGTVAPGYPKVYCFSVEARPFGANATDWRTLPESSKLAYLGLGDDGTIPPENLYEWPNFVIHLPANSSSRFDALHLISELSGGPTFPTTSLESIVEDGGGSGSGGSEEEAEADGPILYFGESAPLDITRFNTYRFSTLSLDQEYKDILDGSLAVLDDPVGMTVIEVDGVETISRSAFALSGKSTIITADADQLEDYRETVRSLTVLAASKELEIAEEADDSVVVGTAFRLPVTVPELPVGRVLSIEGVDANTGEMVSQIVTVKSLTEHPDEPAWILELDEELDHDYVRDRVILRGNIAPATHGQTHVELLGHGDARQSWVKHALKQAPLTYLSSATDPRGIESTLELEIDGVSWQESDFFYQAGPEDEIFTAVQTDAGETIVTTGDGRTGRRPATGVNNLKAKYRSGLGAAGNLDPGTLTNLMSRPLGLANVHHPVPARGGEDPETRDGARDNAPLTVKTLGRLVSLRDYADFAKAFAGIAKAESVWGRFGLEQGILVTIAGADGAHVPDDSKLGENFRDALNRYRDPTVPVRILNHVPLALKVRATIYFDDRYNAEDVLAAVTKLLAGAYDFANRRLGESVTSAALLELLHGIESVVGIDLDELHRSDLPATRETRIPASAGRVDRHGVPHPAELITLDADCLDHLEDFLTLTAVSAANP